MRKCLELHGRQLSTQWENNRVHQLQVLWFVSCKLVKSKVARRSMPTGKLGGCYDQIIHET